MIRNANGFTLIEALVAVAVMAIVVSGLASMGVTTIQADTQSRRVSAATALAQAKLEELRGVQNNYNSYNKLSRVTVTVSWDNGAGSVRVASLFW